MNFIINVRHISSFFPHTGETLPDFKIDFHSTMAILPLLTLNIMRIVQKKGSKTVCASVI